MAILREGETMNTRDALLLVLDQVDYTPETV